jgi:glycosyltransferase involved in cell wall biosynthesis
MTAITKAPVSVVIPTYNSGRLITQALDSVLAQTLPVDEIIVVDDGSTDDSPRYLQPYLDRILYLTQRNQGVSSARNRGIRESKCDFVAFLDADDTWHPMKLELQIEAMRKYPLVGLLGTSTFAWPTSRLPAIDRLSTELMVPIRWEQFVLKTILYPSSVVARRSVILQTDGFDVDLRCSEDRDLWLRIAEVSQVATLNLPLTGYRFVLGSLSQQIVALKEGGKKVLKKVDERAAWKGRWLLRRKAYSFFNYQCSYELSANGNHAEALAVMMKSFAWYPLPYDRIDVQRSWARLRRSIVYFMRMVRLKSHECRTSNKPALDRG